jgi:hypothetical protein
MTRHEVQTGQLGLVNGIQQQRSDMVLVATPPAMFSPESRKGTLYIVTETSQDVSRGRDACELVINTIRKQFYEDSSYSITAALRKAIMAANKALYQYNFSAPQQKRAVVGVSCLIVKDLDLYIVQVTPSQIFLRAEGRLRAIPSNPAWGTNENPASLLRPRALGASLTIDADFYRATLRIGDAVLICSTNAAQILDTPTISALLNNAHPDALLASLLEECQQANVTDTHALALTIQPALSQTARSQPLSSTGLSERSRLLFNAAGDQVARLTGEAAMLFRGKAGKRERKSVSRHLERSQQEDDRMQQNYEEPLHSPNPPSDPPPLNVGESMDDRLKQLREERRIRIGGLAAAEPSDSIPPSAFLGEGSYYPPVAERTVDLSDTPGMAALGKSVRPKPVNSGSEQGPSLGERLLAPFDGLFQQVAIRGRRPAPRPNPSPSMGRRQPGLSYRRQRNPFPWMPFLLLVALVALLIVYGRSLAIDNARQQSIDELGLVEQALSAVQSASDEEQARQLLPAAEEALARVRASGAVTGTVEGQQRYDTAARDFNQLQAALLKLTYFTDLTELGSHPQAAAAATFSTIAVPPPPSGITNTVGFSSIYALDSNAGVLYRMPRDGGTFEPFLSPTDTIATGISVGQVRSMAWRIDNIVAVAQVENGPYIYYFRSNDRWNFSNLGGSEEWGNTLGKQFRLTTYLGNLYFWGVAPGQILRYRAGAQSDLYEPWISDSGRKLDAGIEIAVDGRIYILMPDGRIFVFFGGALEREITPPQVIPALIAPTAMFVTGTPETGAIFLLDTLNERVLQVDKATGEVLQQVRTPPGGPRLDQLSAFYIDDSSPRLVVYLVNGGTVYRALLPDRPPTFRDLAPAATPAPTNGTPPAELPTQVP